MPDDSSISNLVLLIHHVARGSAISGQQLGLTKLNRDTQVVSRMVMSCADVMSAYLAKHGDEVGRELRTFSRNKKFLALAIEDGKALQKEKENEVDKNSMYVLGLEQMLSPRQLESLRTGIPMA